MLNLKLFSKYSRELFNGSRIASIGPVKWKFWALARVLGDFEPRRWLGLVRLGSHGWLKIKHSGLEATWLGFAMAWLSSARLGETCACKLFGMILIHPWWAGFGPTRNFHLTAIQNHLNQIIFTNLIQRFMENNGAGYNWIEFYCFNSCNLAMDGAHK